MKENEEIDLISYDQALQQIKSIHSKQRDFDDGDLVDRLSQFNAFEVRKLVIAELDADEFLVDEELVDQYVAKISAGEISPPIIYDEVNASMIDGIHRLNALKKSGALFIESWVGTEATLDPDYVSAFADDDEDCDVENGSDDNDACVSGNTKTKRFRL